MARSTEPRTQATLVCLAAACGLLALLSACASSPATTPAVRRPNGAGAAGAPSVRAPTSGAAPVAPPPAAPPSPRQTADFNRALGFMRSGNLTEAELEFKQMTLEYPALCAPYVNLGLLYRKAGHLDQSEVMLRNAVQRNGTSAMAWNELGVTQRMRGEFTDAAVAYQQAIAADPNFAPAYRNLGVDADLYLGDPERALTALERYKELTGEDRPVTSWIAELRQRTGKPPVKPANAPAPAPSAQGAPAPSAQGAPAPPAKPQRGA